MKRRLKKVIAISTALLLGGLVYALICGILGFGIPCVFYEVTGWQCPGCGVSRMCLSLLRLDFHGAFEANPVLLLLLPLLIAVAVDSIVRYVRTGSLRTKGWSAISVWIAVVILLVFGIFRNLI